MSIPLLVIADDSPAYLDLMTELLPDAGFPLLHCVTCREALAAIRQHQPDLVLLDINVYNADIGWNTLHQMWHTPAASAIPVLVCTTDPRIVREKAVLLRTHKCSIIEKPFEIDLLLKEIGSLLGRPASHRTSISGENWLEGIMLIPIEEYISAHHPKAMVP